ncbi:hypothetical protein A9A72_10255 [Stutzerimonas stutzeri]|jgi:hypothetical protein|uniref:Uncharacterized protein n=1 Tax=Stutzerimonas stutzeri TaxID=316 RepID=A0A5S5BJX4_STUST|nr:hypothetical protein A9A72_10255 [Stutzerimonas stutzeri]
MSLVIPPVILSEEVTQVVDEGGSVIVICQESVSKKGTAVVGKWIYEVLSADKKSRRLLVYKVRNKPETSLTVSGVASKLMLWGFPGLIMPMQKGQAFELFKDGRYTADWRSDT